MDITKPTSTHRFNYSFDEDRIATTPLAERDQSRLLIYDRKTGKIAHRYFRALLDYLHPNDLLVINDTRVFPARLYARRAESSIPKNPLHVEQEDLEKSPAATPTDNEKNIELLLIRPHPESPYWEALVQGRVPVPSTLILPEGGRAHLIEDLGEGKKKIVFELPEKQDIYAYLNQWGEVPLPPYILRKRKTATEREDASSRVEDQTAYQTVYAQQVGSVAAPTAGLHFTDSLLTAIRQKGVTVATVTLHIGPDTFRPIRADSLDQHKMSGEGFEIPDETVYAFTQTKANGGRIIAVGTSVVRTLESAARNPLGVFPKQGETDLFITPGYLFCAVDALITNLHPPMSTGMVLVSAFVGCDTVLNLYQEAMQQNYRFLSYGDAMLIL